MIGIQIIINIGMCLGMMPVIGVTLPFLSAGGTSTGTLYPVSYTHLSPNEAALPFAVENIGKFLKMKANQ